MDFSSNRRTEHQRRVLHLRQVELIRRESCQS
jgi:hypothetical protein